MTFQVGGNVYRRCEVVAMEWVVQEVLEFKCFMPTTYNFLWYASINIASALHLFL